MIDGLYTTIAAQVVDKQKQPRQKSTTPVKKLASRELVGTALKQHITSLLKVKTRAGCGCNNLASEMDAGGIEWCEKNREYIVDHLVANKDVLSTAIAESGSAAQAAIGWVVNIPFAADAVLRIGANWLLDAAIEESRPKPQQTVVRTTRHGNSRVYTGWRSEADGPRPAMGPFVSTVKHLTYHVYPAINADCWRWNLDQLRARWSLFNGKRIIGIVHDDDSVGPDEVIKYTASIGMHFDHSVIKTNIPELREVVTFIPMLELLKPDQAGPKEVVFSAHAKGAKYDNATFTRNWTDLMYQSCLDDWPRVDHALSNSLMAGSFREYGLLGKWHNWAYSGTFIWWRLQEIGQRKWNAVDQWFAGTESWPGKLCKPEETSCLFLNDSKRMYEEHYWTDTVWPEWEKYKERMSGRRDNQERCPG